MKVYLSCDIEGVAGISVWDETNHLKNDRWLDYFARQMTNEAAAACKGAIDAGASDILVKDAHDSGRNITPAALPKQARLHRGWAGPAMMAEGLDESFAALACIGYHSPAGSGANPLAHTMATSLDEVTLNGARCSEFTLTSYYAAKCGVPVVFASGDAGLCEEAQALIPGITTVATNVGQGGGVESIHPELAAERIRAGMKQALARDSYAGCMAPLPGSFELVVRFRSHPDAWRMGFFPGVQQVDAKTVKMVTKDYDDIMRFFLFAT